ncbi:MAG TPA: DUF4406 domain-containing protein [Streptosporangiaceae bacterium]|nr:DUF4406 domain-containing protein [Streptosporangiaceae bacterium]
MLASLMRGCGLAEHPAQELSGLIAHEAGDGVQATCVASLLLKAITHSLDSASPTIYLSVPITTGRAHLRLRSSLWDAHESDVQCVRARLMDSNRRRADDAVMRLRATTGANVIDPSSLPDIPGWTQPDYHEFWTRVIGSFAEKVAFLDEWQYSVGCTTEFAAAIQLGLPTLTERLIPLDILSGVQLIRSALSEYEEAQVSSASLRSSFEAVKTILNISV